jgi:rhodanese-related sulfurtransferase
MKKSGILLALLAVTILALSYFLFPKNTVSNNKQQASVAQAVQRNNHLQSDVFLARTKDIDTVTIDVRTADEYNAGHIADAINMDFYSPNFVEEISKLDKNKSYSIYCRSGSRSEKTLNIMRGKGFTNIADLAGGYSSLGN